MSLMNTISAIGSLVTTGVAAIKTVMSSADAKACNADVAATTNTI
jgi:hypothetical protein